MEASIKTQENISQEIKGEIKTQEQPKIKTHAKQKKVDYSNFVPTQKERNLLLEDCRVFSKEQIKEICSTAKKFLSIYPEDRVTWETTHSFFSNIAEKKLKHKIRFAEKREYAKITWLYYQKIRRLLLAEKLIGQKTNAKNPQTLLNFSALVQKFGEEKANKIIMEAMKGVKSP